MCQLLTIGHQGYYMLVVLAFLKKKKESMNFCWK